MTDPLPRFALTGKDPALAALLAECAAVPGARFAMTDKADTADVLIVTDYEAGKGKAEKQKSLPASEAARLLVAASDADYADGDEVEGFAGVFVKPLRLAALLDAGINAWKIGKLKTPRQLALFIQLNPFTRRVEDTQRTISQNLSTREAAFLLAVLDAGADGLTREQAITNVWGYHRDVDSHAVETAMYRLRQKLQPLFGDAVPLASEGGIYKWTEKV